MGISESVIAEKLLPLGKELADACMRAAGALKFDKTHPQQLYAICTYGTIIEITFSIVTLAEMKQITSIPILLRTLLDAFASFRCCVNDPNHFKAMYASFMNEKLRLVRAVIDNPNNPYLTGIALTIDAPRIRAELEKELGDIRTQGYSALKPWEEFQKAGLLAEYQSLYWQLCMHAHNNVSSLEDRHLEKKGGDYEVAIFKEEIPEDIVRYLDSVCGILIDASLTLHKLYKTESINMLMGFDERLKAIRVSF